MLRPRRPTAVEGPMAARETAVQCRVEVRVEAAAPKAKAERAARWERRRGRAPRLGLRRREASGTGGAAEREVQATRVYRQDAYCTWSTADQCCSGSCDGDSCCGYLGDACMNGFGCCAGAASTATANARPARSTAEMAASTSSGTRTAAVTAIRDAAWTRCARTASASAIRTCSTLSSMSMCRRMLQHPAGPQHCGDCSTACAAAPNARAARASALPTRWTAATAARTSRPTHCIAGRAEMPATQRRPA